MGTHSKKRKQKKNDMVGNPDNNVAKVNTTSYTNGGFGKPAKVIATVKKGNLKKKGSKKKKPTVYGMTSEDIKKKFKKDYGGA